MQQQLCQARGGGDLVPASQVLAPGLEVGVDVEAALWQRDGQPGGGGVQGRAGRDARGDERRLGEGQGGGVLDRRGGRGPDLAADAEQRAAQPAAERAGGHPGTPIRQPPSARLLLSPVVMTVRSGAAWAGLSSGVAGSCTRSW
jgi:hypothetical protein